MIGNFLRIAYRSLLKNKVFSFVTVFALAIGMATFLMIIHYVRFERSYENFHEKREQIARITVDFYNGSEFVVTDCETHAPMGPLLKDKMPEVTDYVRMFGNDAMLHVMAGSRKFLENQVYFTDASVFRVFTYSFLYGEGEKALTEPLTAVVTETTAKKYFGRTDVLGESIQINKHLYRITGVLTDPPANTHLKFRMLLSHVTLTKITDWYSEEGWNNNNEFTYLLMAPGTDLQSFNLKLSALCVQLKDKLGDARYTAEPIKDIHLYSHKTYEPEVNGSARVVYFLLIVAVFIILIAWVNYINLSTARAIERAREVGIRKVMGSVRSQLIFQFLSESFIVNLLAGVLAFVMFQSLLPFFNVLTGQALPQDFLRDQRFWSVFLGLLLSGSLLAGIYPAFILSSFQPAAVLKGKFKSSVHGQQLRKGLVVFQFASTVILIACMYAVYMQVNHLRRYDLGMDIDRILTIRTPPKLDLSDSVFNSKFNTLKTELLRLPEVRMAGGSETLPGADLNELSATSFTRVGHETADSGYEFYYFAVDADFVPALNMTFIAGRNFTRGSTNHDHVVVNEETTRRLGFSSAEEAVGAKITFRTRDEAQSSTIIGVLKNFYHRSPKEAHLPMLFYYTENIDYISLQLSASDVQSSVVAAQKVWNAVFPASSFNYFFLNEQYDQQYKADTRFGNVMATFSGLAVLIACLGLFGLSSFTIIQRTKEIGIRKVLGATVAQIVHLLSLDFIRVILLAALLALPVSYLAIQNWLSTYAVRVELNAWIFVLPVALILFVALITVSFQTVKTALANPTQSLRQE